jgi:hypothetical protein
MASKDSSLHSGDELSREASLKSFGRNNEIAENIKMSPTSLEQLGVRRRNTLNN